jgi:hypothetical protein
MIKNGITRTYVTLSLGARINAWHDEQFKWGLYTTGHNGQSGMALYGILSITSVVVYT